MTTIINGSSPSITFSDSTTQTTAFTGSASTLTSGTLPSARLPAGSVLQVVQGTVVTATTSTSSSTFVTTGITASITPSSASSKILVLANTSMDSQANSNQAILTIYRNSTNVVDSGSNSGNGFNGAFGASSRLQIAQSIAFLDSPATTSSTTYTIYARGISGAILVNSSCSSYVTLMEIAG